MESNIQEFPCSPWSFVEMQRCQNYVTCNSSFRDRSASCCSFQCYQQLLHFPFRFWFHGRKQKHILDFIGVCEQHGGSVNAHAHTCCRGSRSPGGAAVFVCKHGLIIASSLGLGLPFKKLLLLHGVIQFAVGLVYFLLHDKKLTGLRQTLCRVVPFGQRAHCVWVITDKCRVDATSMHGCGPRWTGFNSFCHTDIKNFTSSV